MQSTQEAPPWALARPGFQARPRGGKPRTQFLGEIAHDHRHSLDYRTRRVGSVLTTRGKLRISALAHNCTGTGGEQVQLIERVFGGSDCIVVGHRGARRDAPENTMAAFRAAGARGATWVEFDVRLSSDEVPVVIHDPMTRDDQRVVDLTSDELAARGVPALADVLRDLPPGMGADVEIKHRPSEPGWDPRATIARICAPTVAAYLGQRPLLVTAFDPRVLEITRQLVPEVPCGLLTPVLTSLSTGLAQARQLRCQVVGPHHTAPGLSAGVGAVHAHGLELLVWTVNNTRRTRRLCTAGVDAICTDDVRGTVSALTGRAAEVSSQDPCDQRRIDDP